MQQIKCSVLSGILFLFSLYTSGQLYSSGQTMLEPVYAPCIADEIPKENPFLLDDKAPGATIFSANFSNSLGSWTSTGADAALWQHDDDGPNGQFAVTANEIISSQSANNGFAIFDADLSNPGGGPWTNRSGQLVSPVIDMTGIPFSFIEFWHKYRFCCDNSFIPKLEVSTNDFVTFASFDATIPGVEPNTISPSYKAKINISAFLDTATNLNNFRLRFNFDGSNGGSHYYWQIDDVKVRESFLYDLINLSTSFFMGAMELPYYFISQSQLSPITFSANVRNDGSLPATNTQLSVNSVPLIGGGNGPGVAVSNPLEIGPALSDLLVTSPTEMFTDTNVYIMNYNLVQDSTDAIPQDNTLDHVITVHGKLYSIDNNQPTGYIANMTGQTGQALKIGNVMEVQNNDQIDSMYVFVTATSTNIGQIIFGELRRRQNGNWVTIGTTGLKAITMSNNGSSIGMAFPTPISVYQGDTLLVLACHSGGTPDVRFRITQKVPDGIVQGYLSDGSPFVLSDPNAIMLRLGMTELVGLEDLAFSRIEIYPNPAKEVLNLFGFEENDAPFSYEILNLIGQVVSTDIVPVVSGHAELSVRHLEPGAYFIRSKNSLPTIRFVKE